MKEMKDGFPLCEKCQEKKTKNPMIKHKKTKETKDDDESKKTKETKDDDASKKTKETPKKTLDDDDQDDEAPSPKETKKKEPSPEEEKFAIITNWLEAKFDPEGDYYRETIHEAEFEEGDSVEMARGKLINAIKKDPSGHLLRDEEELNEEISPLNDEDLDKIMEKFETERISSGKWDDYIIQALEDVERQNMTPPKEEEDEWSGYIR